MRNPVKGDAPGLQTEGINNHRMMVKIPKKGRNSCRAFEDAIELAALSAFEPVGTTTLGWRVG